MMTSLEKINTPISNTILDTIIRYSLHSNFIKGSMWKNRFFLLAVFSKDLVLSTGKKDSFNHPTLN